MPTDIGKQHVDALMSIVRDQGASDLHLSVGRHPIIRVSGQLTPIETYPALSADELFAILQVMVRAEALKPLANLQEIDFAYFHETTNQRLRGSAFQRQGVLSIALRILKGVRTIEDLNLPDTLIQFARAKQGFFLVVGPVGQGKSTTLAALLDVVNRERREHIVTIEQPIEYVHQDKRSIIDQREVGLDSTSFAEALTSAFRQDVNVILIGEMRDAETMATAVTAAETGHLVFSTLHTNTAAQTVDRIIDTFPAEQQDQVRAQLSGSLLGIFSQRLIPSLRGGQVPAFELLINTKAVANIIREGRTHELDTLIETGSEHGMVSMNRSLIELVRAGHITIEDARRLSANPQGIDGLL
jgi:twitching motility protein PilT